MAVKETTPQLTVAIPEALRTALESRVRSEGNELLDVVVSAIESYLQKSISTAKVPGRYGQGRLFRRGRRFWIAVWAPTASGEWREIRETTGTDKEDKAREFLRRRIRGIENHKEGIQAFTGPSQERTKVNELLDSLLTDYQTRGIKSLRHCICHMRPVRSYFGERRAINVTPDLVRKYIEVRKSDGRSNAKINREVELLNAAYCLAVREGRLNRKPHVPRLRERNARAGFFEKDEVEQIVKFLPSPIDDITRFGFLCGWRREEIRTLKWENVDRQAREITLIDSKNGERRTLPLDESGWLLFECLWEARRYQRKDGTEAVSAYVFHRKGRPVASSPFSRAWSVAREKAGLPAKLFHDLRRSAARNLLRSGIPQAIAMSITGHRTDSMFRRYAISSSQDKREALRRQHEFLASSTSKTNLVDLHREDSDKTRTVG
jgi:integrase